MAPFPPEDFVTPAASDLHSDASRQPHEPRLLTRRDPNEVAAETQPARRARSNEGFGHIGRVWSPRPEQTSAPRPRPTARHLGAVAKTLIALGCLAGVVLLIMIFWARHAMHAALPQIDGTLHVGSLSAPVTVTRDAQGVPSIQAANLDDLLFAQGYVTAQDRLWQMDMLRRHAAGTLAEVLGRKFVDHDRQQRILQLRAAADRAYEVLPPAQQQQLQDYARGVNAFISSHSAQLPLEFHLLHYTPEPWQPRDSLLVGLAMWQDLSTGFPAKLTREALAQHLPAALLTDLYPVGGFRDRIPSQPRIDLTVPRYVEQIPLDSSQSALHMPALPTATPQDLITRAQALNPTACNACRAGSNGWAVSAARSASGAPLVSNDMHLNLGVPDIWYETSLHAPASNASTALDVTGFTLPGVPFVLVGRNAHVAWSVTNLGADVQDVYIEHVRGSGAQMEYERPDGTWTAVAHHTEVIRVRAGLNVTLDVLTTAHPFGATTIQTPIITPLYPSEHRALSLAWTAYDPAAVNAPFLAIDTATSGVDLVAAFSTFGGPSLNLIYADDQHHIGYHAVGFIPIRGSATPQPRQLPQLDLTPAPGDTTIPEPETEPGTGQDNTPDQSAEPALTPQASLTTPGISGNQELLVSAGSAQRFRPHQNSVISTGAGQFYRPAEWRDLQSCPSCRYGFRTAVFTSRPHLLMAAYSPEPQRRRRRAIHRAKIPVRREPRHHTRRRRAASAAATHPDPTQAPVLPPPPPLNYTIGSPLADTPVDALNPAYQWSGYIPYNQLPAITDPADGVLATANARITPDDYPYSIADNWVDGYRVERIHRLFDNRAGLTPADMLAAQMDTHSAFDHFLAQRLAYAVDHANPKLLHRDTRRLQQAANLLRDFDGNMSTDSAAATIVSAVHAQLWPALLLPQIRQHDHLAPNDNSAAALLPLYRWHESTTALELILNTRPARWLPSGYANWNDFLTAVLESSLKTRSAPSNLAGWTYGSQHRIDLQHPLLSHRFLPRLLATRISTGGHPIGGDQTTLLDIGLTHQAFGPSERFTADLASPDATYANLTTGESGNPASRWYLDQFLPWLRGATFALPLDHPAAAHTLTLEP